MKSPKKLQGKNVTMIKAQTALLGFQGKLGLYKYFLGHCKFEYFLNLALLDRQGQNAISVNDLLIYMSHLENLEDWKSRFCDLQ